MCKGNTIITSWSRVNAFICIFLIAGGIIATFLGADLTWGEIVIIPFVLSFLLNKKCYFCFTGSGFTVQWLFRKHTVSEEEIKQIDVFGTKSGTWIVVELNGASTISPRISRTEILIYCLRHLCKSFLIPLQWGQRDKALEILRMYYPHKIVMASKLIERYL